MIPLLGFAPDLDPTTPGVLVDCDDVYPSVSGIKPINSLVRVGTPFTAPAFPAQCQGLAVLTGLNGKARLVGGSAFHLYEIQPFNGTLATVSSGTYAALNDARWSFTQFGDASIAANPTDVLQRASVSAVGSPSTFADIASSPQAEHIVSASGFVMALNTSTYADGWWCSAYLNETDWAPALSTQATKGRLVDAPGAITAAKELGEDIVAYKEGALYVGRYVGSPVVWQWRRVTNDVGCIGPDAVCDTPIGHVFVGRENIYVFDGTVPRTIGTGVIRKWFFDNIQADKVGKTQCVFDPRNALVWIFFASDPADAYLKTAVVYNIGTQKWGKWTGEIVRAVVAPAKVQYYPQDPTENFGNNSKLYAIERNGTFSAFEGTYATTSFTTGDFGDDEIDQYVDSLRVRYLTAPTSSTATGFYKAAAGDALTQASTSSTFTDGRYDMRQTGRFHRFKIGAVGNYEAAAVRPRLKPAGRR